jgi:tetratricopeptide (TPR) repeat protein
MTDHPLRDELYLYVTNAESIDAADRVRIRTHIEMCGHCSQEAEDLQLFETTLRDIDFADYLARPTHTAAALHAMFLGDMDRRHVDREIADAFFNELMARPVHHWKSMLADVPAQCTEGLARRILREVDVEMNRRPKFALQLLGAAEHIASHLTGDDSAAISGDVCKQRANAYRHLGQYDDSLAQCDLAIEFYSTLLAGDYDILQAQLTSAITLFKMTEYKRALSILATIIPKFRAFGVNTPYIRALILHGNIVVEQGDTASGVDIYRQALKLLQASPDPAEEARILANLADCNLRLLDYEQAITDAHSAIARYDSLRMEAESNRSAWTLALARLRIGDQQALHQLGMTAHTFDTLGMILDAGFVRLDITEELLRREDSVTAAATARELVPLFARAGVTLASVEAINYLRIAVEANAATPDLVEYIRAYVTADDPKRPFTPPRIN